jgi:hypothetical protein
MHADQYDLAAHLVVGSNSIVALVTFYGEATSFWQPAPRSSNVDAALVFEAQIGDLAVVSDDSWKVQRSPAWTVAALPEEMLGGLPIEVFDIRLLPDGWLGADFDDTSWQTASLLRAQHFGGRAESRPPTYPFGALPRRTISYSEGPTVEPARVCETSDRSLASWESANPVLRVLQALRQPVESSAACELPQTATIDSGALRHIEFDFGRIVAGFVELDIEAPAGTEVELHYRQERFNPDVPPGSDPMTGARLVCGDGLTRYASVELSGLRYLHLVVHAESRVQVTLERVAVREYLYPRRGGAYFRSDDPTLDRLYRAGIRTVQLNSFDAYTDCPTREQRAWTGDAVVHQLVDLTTNDDWGLARNFGELGTNARPDGILPMVLVGDSAVHGGLTIPDWSLSWTHGVYLMYRYDGDLERMQGLLPVYQRVLQWYERHRDERGTLADLPEWNLVDWATLGLSGRSAVITALWARSLSEFAELSEAAGNSGSAAWARKLHAAAAAGFEDFWDPDRGLYVDHLDEEPGTKQLSQAANAAAIVSGLAPVERWEGIVERITDPDRLVVRSWIDPLVENTSATPSMPDILKALQGLYEVDWDVEREIVQAEPFFSYVVHDAVTLAGQAHRLPDLLLRWESLLNGDYDTFGECWGWGTPVHGWSSTPTRDLVAYVLGITPEEPGYERVRIAPRPGRLTELAGSVPSPFGPIEVKIAGGRVQIDSPVPVRFVPATGTERDLTAGVHELALS